MSGLRDILIKTPVILLLLLAMVLVGMAFGPVQAALDGPLLDMIGSGEAARARLAEMGAPERRIHFWTTVALDTLYPLAYGGFLAGLAGRFAPLRWRGLVMLPAALTILVDLMENTVQALALAGVADLLALKTILTPVKFGLFGVAALLALALAGAALVRRLTGRGRREG